MMYVKNIALALIVIGILLLITRNTENFEVVEMKVRGSTCSVFDGTNNGCDSGLYCVTDDNKIVGSSGWNILKIGTCQSCSEVDNGVCTRA